VLVLLAATADGMGDATLRDTYQSHTCLIRGCSRSAQPCPRGSMCCDLSVYGLGTLCAPACP